MSALIESNGTITLVCEECGRIIAEYEPPAALNELDQDAFSHLDECDGD